MNVSELEIFGLLLSPLSLMVVVASIIAVLASRLISRVLPRVLLRQESLVGLTTFSLALALLVGMSF